VVTVGGKDATHPYNGQGSGLGYIIDGVQSPTFNIGVGETITFDVSDSTNYNHPIGFYVDAEKSDTATGSTSGVNTAGQAGATVSYTPNSTGTFYYMCENHGYMGGSIVVS
jgi:plastocyanin